MRQKRFSVFLDPSYLRKTMTKKWQVLNQFEIIVKILVGKEFKVSLKKRFLTEHV